MSALSRLIRRPAVQEALTRFAAAYIRFVWRTGRWTIRNGNAMPDLIARKQPFIVCFWHGRLLMMSNMWPGTARMNVLISRHRDGVFISRTIEHLGLDTIAGSSSKGGAGALMAMVRVLRKGEFVGITPDGPRGPRMRVAPGAIAAARLSGALLLPMCFSARWRIVAGSWDRMVIPLPFTRGIVEVGAPVEVPPDADAETTERLRQRFEAEMIARTRALDAEIGVEPISPDVEPSAAAVGAEHA
jgi:lysophospholipid acyltransferase (LPLAT)-like uncharacterized protein